MTTKNAMLELQRAIVTKLRADAALDALVSGVFDRVPQDQSFPYVQVGYSTQNPWDAFSSDGFDLTTTIYVWHEAGYNAPGLAVAAEIERLLDDVRDLDVDGFHVVRIWLEFMDTTPRDNDTVTRSIPIRFRAWLQRVT